MNGQPLDNTQITVTWPSFSLDNVDSNGVVFDNFFVYGANIEASADADIVTDAITLQQGGNDNDDNQDNQQGTGDLSVLAYAAAAAAGCGALIIRRKK